MALSGKTLSLFLAIICCAGQSATTAHHVAFELRLAENKPAKGLVKATVENSGEEIYLYKEVVVTNADVIAVHVIEADPARGYTKGSFNIEIVFTDAAAERMGSTTGRHIGGPLAVLIDGKVVVAPTIQEKITDTAVITGRFTKEEAERIARGISQ